MRDASSDPAGTTASTAPHYKTASVFAAAACAMGDGRQPRYRTLHHQHTNATFPRGPRYICTRAVPAERASPSRGYHVLAGLTPSADSGAMRCATAGARMACVHASTSMSYVTYAAAGGCRSWCTPPCSFWPVLEPLCQLPPVRDHGVLLCQGRASHPQGRDPPGVRRVPPAAT